MMRFFVLLAAPIAAIALGGCVATAQIGTPATSTPAPAPTPQPPQIVYIQQPPAQPAQADYGINRIDAAVFVVLIIIGSSAIATCAYFIGHRHGQSANTRETSYFAGMYQVSVTPAEYQALTQWRQRQQLTQANSQWMVKR